MSDTKPTAIKVDNVTKIFKLPHERHSSLKGLVVSLFRGAMRFEKQKALNNVSFEIKKGEFFGIVGRNGSGKSTMLKLLAGIYEPTKGSIQINGKLTPFIELGVGFNPELTGRENVFLNGALLGFSRKEMAKMYDDIVDFAEIEKFMDQKLKNYSSGMQVRLAFSIAIRAESDILLIDEVLAVGDSVFQQKCYDYFDQIKKSDKTVVFVSHDMGAVQSFCDRAILINNGEPVVQGDPMDVVHAYSELLSKDTTGNKDIEQKNLVHVGTGGAEILKAEIIDEKGKPVHRVSENSPFGIRLHYKTTQTINDAVIGVGIMSKKDESILGPNTREAGISNVNLAERGSIEAVFPAVPLAPGKYRIRASIMNTSNTIAYDFVEELTTLTVVGSKRYGEVYIEPKWTIN
jgi:ABC-2 type transport system ATP-binding protein